MMVQLSIAYSDPSTTMHSIADRRTDDSIMPIAEHTV